MASDISFTISKKDSQAVVKVKKCFNFFMKLVVSVLFTVVLALYFVVPQDLISIWHIIAIVALILFLEITFVGRLFCKTVCPYSNFQSVMYDADTMRVALLPDRADACINCKACVRVCPTGLDIREGLSNTCVLCASCVDACTEIMAKLGKKTCVDYMFGRQRLNLFTPNKIITFILAVLFLLAGLISFSRIGGLSVHTDELTRSQDGTYRFELVIKSTFPEATVVQVHGKGENRALELPRRSYTLNKGESVVVPVAVSGRYKEDSVMLYIKMYQGRKESVKNLTVELNK